MKTQQKKTQLNKQTQQKTTQLIQQTQQKTTQLIQQTQQMKTLPVKHTRQRQTVPSSSNISSSSHVSTDTILVCHLGLHRSSGAQSKGSDGRDYSLISKYFQWSIDIYDMDDLLYQTIQKWL